MAKILELCLSPDLGGLELYMKNVTKNLCTLAVIKKSSKLKAVFENENLSYTEVGKFAFLKIAKLIDEMDIDIVHIHWSKDILTAVLAKIFSRKKPKIVQTRHMHMTRFKSDFYHKFLYKNLSMIVAVTQLVSEQLKQFIPVQIRPNIKLCYLGVKEPQILNDEQKTQLKSKFGLKDEFVVGVIGRVEESKGQHLLLKVAEILRKKGNNLRILVVGGAMNKSYFEGLKAKFSRDIFTGHVTNVSEIMQICDCVVLTTKKETFGLVLVEAMRAGVCVLASNSGGPKEIIDNEQNGLLFESFDENALATQLLRVINDETLRQNLAKNGKIKADENFNETTHFMQLKCILSKI